MLPWRSPTPTFWLYERTKTSLGKHQKADDVGAAGWPRGPWWVGVVLCEGLGKGLWGHKAHSSKAKEKEWLPIITKQESTQGHEDQSSPRRKFVSLLPAHQKSEITDFFLATFLKNEVLKIIPTQKQTCSNQWTRFRAFITTGDYNSHAGLGVKCSKKVATAICGANILAKLSTVPVQRLLWKQDQQAPHCPLQVNRLLWLCVGEYDLWPQRHWHRLSPCTPEATADGWGWWLLHFCQGLQCHSRQLRSGQLWRHLQDL